MSKRTLKEKNKRRAEFLAYRAQGGKLNNYGNRKDYGKLSRKR